MNPDETNPPKKPPTKNLQVSLDPETAKGRYCNHVSISHTREEFVLDFALIHPPVGAVHSRLILSPAHAKRLVAAIQDNIAKYEARNGPIAVRDDVTAADIIQ